MMNAAQLADFWASKSDEVLRAAGREIATYNEVGQEAIRAELKNRGIAVDECGTPVDSPRKTRWIFVLLAIVVLPLMGLALIAIAPALLAVVAILIFAFVVKLISALAVLAAAALVFVVLREWDKRRRRPNGTNDGVEAPA